MKVRFTPSVMPPRPAEVPAKDTENIQGIVKEKGKEKDENSVCLSSLLTNHLLSYPRRDHLEF